MALNQILLLTYLLTIIRLMFFFKFAMSFLFGLLFLADVNLRSRSLYAIGRPSVCLFVVCRLSSVTLVHPTQPVEVFGNFFSPYDSSGTLVF